MAVQSQSNTPPCLTAALYYARDRGWRVFPLQPKSKKPFPGTRGLLDATTDEAIIRRWWMRWPAANVAIACGRGLGVVDEDTYKGGDVGPLSLPPTLTSTTPRGGRHLLYVVPGEVRPEHTGKLGKGVDFQGDGSYIVAPPSRTADGVYAWLDIKQPVADLPGRVLDVLARPVKRAENMPNPISRQSPARDESSGDYWVEKAMERARIEGRNNAGLWLACQLRDNECSDPEGAMLYYARMVEDWDTPRYTEREALATLRGVLGKAKREAAKSQKPPIPIRPPEPTPITQAKPRTDGANALKDAEPARKRYAYTEFGNAERLIDAHGANIRFNKAFGFCVWDGQRWQKDDELTVRRWAKRVVREMYTEAAELGRKAASIEDEDKRKEAAAEGEALMRWARSSETKHMVDAMVNLIRDACHLDTGAFDAHPMLFNCANGTLDLRAGRMRPHRREDYLTQMSHTAADAEATCPIFAAFVKQIMCDREELVGYLRRVFGYCLTGSVAEQVWHLMVGEKGDNGKSTLMEAIGYVLGEYGTILDPESVTITKMQRDGAAPSPDIAELKGKRFVKVTETEEGARLAPARIKKLSGGDELRARFLRKDLFSFFPSFKIFIYTNHKPQARETTHAFWRRVRYIPFEFSLKDHPEVKKDGDLLAKLKDEAPGILAWMMRGCIEWQKDGLNPPKVVLDATASYRDESDILKGFLEERCARESHCRVAVKALYAAYAEWCEEAGERNPLPQRILGTVLKERGFEQQRGHNGMWTWIGLGLLAT